jgi:transcriptional regulator with XRE-family HTH domain
MTNKLHPLTRIRSRVAMSQRELAKRSGVSQKTLSNIETGFRLPDPVTVGKIAQALGLEFDEVYDAIFADGEAS